VLNFIKIYNPIDDLIVNIERKFRTVEATIDVVHPRAYNQASPLVTTNAIKVEVAKIEVRRNIIVERI
jgi:hypothetical protein